MNTYYRLIGFFLFLVIATLLLLTVIYLILAPTETATDDADFVLRKAGSDSGQ